MRWFPRLFAGLSLCCLSLVPVAGDASETLIVGIVPQHSSSELTRQWNPIMRYLGEQTGYRLLFRPAPNIPSFEQRLYDGRYDVAYMNPYHYIVAHDRAGYQAFARQQGVRIQGVLVVHRDAPFMELQQLANQTLAFPSSDAFAASILPRAGLWRAGVPFSQRYVGSHDKVYRGVAYGRYAAGGGIMRTLERTSPEIRARLRVLWTSDEYTPHAFAARRSIDPHVVQRLQQAMLHMAQTPAGRELLAAIEFDAIAAAQDSDWDDIRKLKQLLDDRE